MTWLDESTARRYATEVVSVLADYFPTLASNGELQKVITSAVAEQAAYPDHRFELIVTCSRTWRLHQNGKQDDRWRVHLVHHDDSETRNDVAFALRVNDALRAIELED